MRIFVSPLDWGLGHAARCIPIIRYLLDKKIEVIIGAEGAHLLFLKEHFPGCEFIDFPGYRISYSNTLPVGVKVLLQLPQMISAIKKEHEILTDLIKEKKIDAVISDNRYGLWNKNIPSVIITHQLNIQAPAGDSLLSKTVYNYIRHFNECWISDYAGKENLSGALSHPIPQGLNAKYIGPLSRFQPQNAKAEKIIAGRAPTDLLIILSGPEPQRTKLEEIILKQLQDLPAVKAFIIQGLPGATHPPTPSLPSREGGHVEIAPHLPDTEFLGKILSSDIILSRPGYSTLMDLDTIGWKKSIFIPTPGQTEHEYLGKLLREKGLAVTYTQKGFSLKEALEKAKQLKPVQSNYKKEDFKKVVDEWVAKVRY